MHKLRTIRNVPQSEHTAASRKIRQVLLKKVWLPTPIYEALPIIYICCGLVALAAALHLPGWAWVLPWALVFGLAAIHLGLGIITLRHRFRRNNHQPCTEEEHPTRPDSSA